MFILARGASYHEASEQFKEASSGIDDHHKEVLTALVKLSADIIGLAKAYMKYNLKFSLGAIRRNIVLF